MFGNGKLAQPPEEEKERRGEDGASFCFLFCLLLGGLRATGVGGKN